MMTTPSKILVLTAFLAVSHAVAQPRFAVRGGLEHELGKVRGDVHDTLTITNSGSGVLHIISINPTCGCTAAVIDTNAIPAGASAHVFVKIEPPDVMGRIHKTIEFLSNDLSAPRQIVGYGFEVLRELGATPHMFAFAGCRIGKPCDMAVTIYNVSDTAVSLFRMPMTMPGLRCMMPDSVGIPAHDSLRYTLRLTADNTGLVTGKFHLRTTSKLNPQMEFSVFANVADKNGMPVMPHR